MEPIGTEMKGAAVGLRVLLLSAGAFVVGTDGFVVVGLLPEIARSLDVGIGAAGQMVSSFALAYAVLAPVLATLASRMPRRRVLVAALLLLGAGNALTASLDDYALVIGSRVLAGAGAALFMASAVAAAAQLAPQERQGRAITTVTAGSTLSLVLGAPLGTLVGGAFGWQAAIWSVSALALLVALGVAVLLPPLTGTEHVTLLDRVRPLGERRVLLLIVTTLVAFVGIFLPFTYLAAVFAPAVGGEQSTIALLLGVFGVFATIGNLLAGRLVDAHGGRWVVLRVTSALAVLFLLMIGARHDLVLAVVAHAVSGLLSFAVIGPQQQRVVALAPPGGAAVLASSINSAAYLGNVGAGVAGAALLGPDDDRTVLLLVAAASAAAGAAALTWWSGLRSPRPSRRAAS